MGALLGIGGLVVFFIFMIISLINIFRKKPKKKTVIVMIIGLVFFIVGISIGNNTNEKLSGDVKAEVDLKDEKHMVKNNEDIGKYITSLRDVYAEKNKYIEEDIISGPLKVLGNDVERGVFRISPSLGDGFADYDDDVYVEIYYKNMSDEKKWRNVQAKERPIIYVKGIVRMYSNSNDIYIYANDINDRFNNDWILDSNDDSLKEQAVEMTAEEYFKKGNEFFSQNTKESHEKAYECYKKAAEIEPSNIKYLKNTAASSRMFGRYEEAIEYEKKVIKINANEIDVYAAIASNYSNLGNYDEALKYYDKAIELDANNYLHYFGKAIVLNESGNYSEAFSFYKKAYELDKKSFKEWVDLRLSKAIIDNSASNKFIELECAMEFLMFSDYVFELENIGFDILQKPSVDDSKYEIRVYKGSKDKPEAVYFFYINAYNGNIEVGY